MQTLQVMKTQQERAFLLASMRNFMTSIFFDKKLFAFTEKYLMYKTVQKSDSFIQGRQKKIQQKIAWVAFLAPENQ